MNLITRFRHGKDSNRQLRVRRPIVEDLEGRQLLSGIVGSHIGTSMIQGGHIGTSMVQGGHIGTSMVQGGHIGTSMVQGGHIGM